MFDPLKAVGELCAAAAAMPNGCVRMSLGAEMPRKSKAEMAALAVAAGVTPTVHPHGKLWLHEEFAGEVADAILGRAADTK